MLQKATFIDTWGWLALGHRKDVRHSEVKELYKELRQQGSLLYTSNFVLDELITLLFRREHFYEATQFVEGIFSAIHLNQLNFICVTSNQFMQAWELRKRFDDKPLISFTDLTSMVIMQEHKIKEILTDDNHFIQVGMGFIIVP